MKSWFPEKGEQWVFTVEIDSVIEQGGKRFVKYRPQYMQQAGAIRELEQPTFTKLFSPIDINNKNLSSGNTWVLVVEVTNIDKDSMNVDYRHILTDSNVPSDVRRMSLHVFRSSFRRMSPDSSSAANSEERDRWLSAQRAPKRGSWYIMSVKILDIQEVDGKRVIKYKTLNHEQVSAPRLLEESAFKGVFEPVDGLVPDLRRDDEWFMLVEVTDYAPEEFAVWYRPIDSKGEKKGNIRHLSDYTFLATFKPAK